MKQYRQRGVTVVGGLVTVLIVIALAFSGWLVWQKNKITIQAGDPKSTSQTSPAQELNKDDQPDPGQGQEVVDSTSSWKSHSSALGVFSFKYPRSWTMPSNLEECAKDTTENSQVMIGPNQESAGKCQSGNSGQVSIGSYTGDQRYPAEPDSTTTDVTVQGVSGTRTASVVADEDGFHPYGTKFVTYQFHTNNRTYRASYRQWPTETDQLTVFETIVTQTLRFTK